jgi:hypothetical protein
MDTMKAKTVNSVRRQVLIAAVSIVALPEATAWATKLESSRINDERKLVLSGRLTGSNGIAISGAVVELEHHNLSTLTDADGRCMLISSLAVVDNVALLVASRNGEPLRKIANNVDYKLLDSNGVLRSSVSLKI